MGEDTKIEWASHTFNPWSGCAKVSPGCVNCYAEALAKRFPHLGNWGPSAERKRTSEANWRKPLAWNRAVSGPEAKCSACGLDRGMHGPVLAEAGDPQCGAGVRSEFVPRRPRVFCASLADWLDPEVPAEWLADLLALIAATPNLDWLLLTKRPELWRERVKAAAVETVAAHMGGDKRGHYLAQGWLRGQAPKNVWVGTTVEDQLRAEDRLGHLADIPARIRFLSCEPLLGPVDLGLVEDDEIHWVICGGESGPGARPMHPDWARSLRDQCQAAGVAFFFKQWGEWAPSGKPKGPGDVADGGGVALVRVGKHSAGRLLDGHEWSEAPRG